MHSNGKIKARAGSRKKIHFIDLVSFISICQDLINQICFLCWIHFIYLLEFFFSRVRFISKIDTLNDEAAVLNVELN